MQAILTLVRDDVSASHWYFQALHELAVTGFDVFLCLSTGSGKIDAVCAGTYQLVSKLQYPSRLHVATIRFISTHVCNYLPIGNSMNSYVHSKRFLKPGEFGQTVLSLPCACVEKRAGSRDNPDMKKNEEYML